MMMMAMTIMMTSTTSMIEDDDANGVDLGVDDVDVGLPARSYRRYSGEEEAALYLGVQRYGVGRWASILRANDGLRSRSRVDLKQVAHHGASRASGSSSW